MTNKQAAIQVLTTLRQAGFQALFAGGCVRDMLIGREPKDHDVATDASPQQVCGLFRRRIEVGAQFGVVVVMIGDEQIEVATFRTDGSYADGRRPDSVTFSDPKADALRRDFTINGMFYDPLAGEVIDYVGGREDLALRRIRTIGNPFDRFGEDYLRMLRAVRFSTELDFPIEDNTWQAIRQLSQRIVNVSGERVAAELERIFAVPARSKGVVMLKNSGIIEHIFPVLCYDKLDQGVKVLERLDLPVQMEKGLAAMFIGCQVPEILKMTAFLKLSNNQLNAVAWILDNRGKLLEPQMKFSVLKPLLADERFEMMFDVQRAFQSAAGQGLENLQTISQRAEKLKGTVLLPPPLLNGNEIIALGAQPGPKVGSLCRKLYEQQLDGIITTKDQAAAAIQQWLEDR